MARIKVGTSGFSFPDWRGGVIYPEGLPQKEELMYYNKELRFDTLEVNSTYYTIISEKSTAAMEQKTGEGFEFVVKGFKGITHDPFDSRLDKKPTVEKAMEDLAKFKGSLGPFIAAGKLGAVLFQFPVFFYPSKQAEGYIEKCKKTMDGIPLVIEFRNNEWAKPETFSFLRDNEIGYCAVDEPKLPRLMPLINEVTSGIAYMRLHGRNENWFNAPTSVRYDYLYNEDELKGFLPELKKMADKAQKVYLFLNNCHAGSAVKNAVRMRDLLKSEGLF
jgi:uncharacterized protein YecE (DUF72 family)